MAGDPEVVIPSAMLTGNYSILRQQVYWRTSPDGEMFLGVMVVVLSLAYLQQPLGHLALHRHCPAMHEAAVGQTERKAVRFCEGDQGLGLAPGGGWLTAMLMHVGGAIQGQGKRPRVVFESWTFTLPGRVPESKVQRLDLALTGRGIRETARGLGLRTATGMRALHTKRRPCARSLSPSWIPWPPPMWQGTSGALRTRQERTGGLGATLARATGAVAGQRASQGPRGGLRVWASPGCGVGARQSRLAPGGRTRDDTDSWGAARRHRDAEAHAPGQRHTPQSARNHLPFRPRIKRLARTTLCGATAIPRPAMGLGLLVHRYVCGLL